MPLPIVQPPRVGAFLSSSQFGAADFNGALANWRSITGIDLPVTRWYQAQGDFSIGTTLSQMVAAGKKVCLTLRPDFNPTNPAHLTAIDTMLSTLKAQGANLNITLWHEPFFSGLTAAQFVAMVNFYGPTVRNYYPLWVVYSGSDADIANGFYPGNGTCDGVAVDAYALSGTTQILNAQSIAATGGKPFGIWEYNGGADLGSPVPVQGQTQAFVTAHFQFIQDLFTSRRASGLPNGDLLLFNSGTFNFLTTALSGAGGFEGGIGSWVNAGGCTIAQTTAEHKSFTASLALTATSTSNMLASHCPVALANLTASAMPVVAGQIVMTSAWFKAATLTRSCQTAIFWYDATGLALSSSFSGAVANSTSTFVNITGSATAPANAAFAVLRVQVIAPAAAGELHWVDDPQIGILPASNDLDSAIQYPWDYRIALLASMIAALDVAPVVASGVGRGISPLSRVGPQAGLLTLGAPLSPFDPPPGQGIQRYSFSFRLVDGVTGLNKGLVYPVQDSIPQLTHDVTRTIKRSLTIQFGVVDSMKINVIRDRILVAMVMADGTSYPLGRYMFTDGTEIVSTGGDQTTATLMDEEFVMDQQRESAFPPASLTQRRADAAGQALGQTVVAVPVDIDQLTTRLMLDFPGISTLFEGSAFTSSSTWSYGTTSLQILSDLATQGDYFPPWANNTGFLRMIRSFEPSQAVPTVDWDRYDHVYADTITRTNDILAAPNRFVVVSNSAADSFSSGGVTQANIPVVGTYDVPVNAPHSIPNRGFVVPQVQQLQLPAGASAQATAVARNIGIQSTVFERVTLTTFPDPRHDSFDVVRWLGANWLELSWSMDLIAGGNMLHTLTKTYAP